MATTADYSPAERQPKTTHRRGTDAIAALDDSIIAELPPTQLSRMDCNELARVVRTARLPFLSTETDEHLELRDRQTLERLANLARRCCHNRTTARRSRGVVASGGE